MNRGYYREMAAIEERHWWFLSRRHILNSVLESLPLNGENHILDAGCGTGGTLALLCKYGTVHALEPFEWARKIADSRGTANVVYGKLPEHIPFEEELFDVITLLDVLEHIEEDSASMKALRRRLKPGGFIIITVPAFPSLWSHHDEINHHKRRYRKKDLERVIEDAELQVNYISYYNTLLFPGIAFTKLLKRFLNYSATSDNAVPLQGLNRFLNAIFSSERFLIPRFSLPFGVSLLAVARRT